MSDWEVTPLEGVGPITFGSTPEEVRKAVGSKPKTLRVSPFDVYDSDVFEEEGFTVDYDKDGKCSAVEFSGPVSPTLEGVDLLAIDDVNEWLGETGDTLVDEDSSYISDKYGLAFYVPEDTVKCVLAFKKGYYEEGGVTSD